MAELGDQMHIKSDAQGLELKNKHLVDVARKPYTKTYGLPVLKVRRVSRLPYKHKRGAIGIVKYC